MKKHWLNKQGNKDCILFFNGWGMDEKAIRYLDSSNFDICMFNEYHELSSIDEDLSQYDAIYVVAWSLGVWVASHILSQSSLKIAKAIAINGTQQPIDDKLGISPSIFQLTLNTWDDKNRSKFYIRMFGGQRQYILLSDRISDDEPNKQKQELSHILQQVFLNEEVDFNFDCALIGTNDLIFTSVNQKNYWNAKTRIVEIEIPHYPFTLFESWDQIIKL